MHVLGKFRHCPICGSKYFVEQNEKNKHCESCGSKYFLNLSSAIAAFILNEQGELLVIRRKSEPGRGTLDLPDGFYDVGETIGEALMCEVREETNLAVKEKHYFCPLPNKYRYSDFDVPALDVFFVCKIEDEAVLKTADSIEETTWLLLSKARTEQFRPRSIHRALYDFLQMEPKNLKK